MKPIILFILHNLRFYDFIYHENYNCLNLYLLKREAQKFIRTWHLFFFTAACTGQVPVVTLLLHAGKGFTHLPVYAVC